MAKCNIVAMGENTRSMAMNELQGQRKSGARLAEAARLTSDVAMAVVMPCFRSRATVMSVLDAMPDTVDLIICVDDGCPEGTGARIRQDATDPRVQVITLPRNKGVGGAMAAGYAAALEAGAEIIVKIDSDGQMDPRQLHRFTDPIAEGRADYTKGNRFYFPSALLRMPAVRLIGNSILSFASKLSTGYWQIFDVNNGYTAIHADILRLINLDKLDCGYFFESEMLFRLNTLRAVVLDIPMQAIYGDEASHLIPLRVGWRFAWGHLVNFHKRLFYNYLLRDFQVASVEWIAGPALVLFGIIFGILNWLESSTTNVPASAGTIMIAALPIIVGVQMTLSALSFDISNQPRDVVHPRLSDDRKARAKSADRAVEIRG